MSVLVAFYPVSYISLRWPTSKADTHLFSLKKPLSVLLSLMVTVKKFMVTSVTVTLSRLVKLGDQCVAGSWTAGCSPVRRLSVTWRLRGSAESFSLLGWGTGILLVHWVRWLPCALLRTSGLNAQVYEGLALPACLGTTQDLGVMVVSAWNRLVSWMRLRSDVSPWWSRRRDSLDRPNDTCSSGNLLLLGPGSAGLLSSSLS